jgi:hypothetical protein
VDGALPLSSGLHGSFGILCHVPLRILFVITLVGRHLSDRDYLMFHFFPMLAKMVRKLCQM